MTDTPTEPRILTPPGEEERWTDPTLLDHLDRLRRPLDALCRRIVQGTLLHFLPLRGGDHPLVEVGSGGGQLARWLPDELRPRVLHTEPSPSYVLALRRRHPEARVGQGSVYALPLQDGSQAGVLGLCTFDALREPGRARDEIRRVLRPGGVFCHFLDLGADLEAVFLDLIARGDLPLPNFLAEEVLLHHTITPAQRARLPHRGPLDDLLVTSQESFRRAASLLERTRHPLSDQLTPYARLFDPGTLDSRRALEAFIGLVSDRPRLAEMNRALLSVYLTLGEAAHRDFIPLSVTPFSSYRHLRDKMEGLFGPDDGFRVELSDVVLAREVRPRDDQVPPGCRYRGRWVGRSVVRTEVPAIPGTPLERLLGQPPFAAEPARGEYLLEMGMFVFVARRQPSVFSERGASAP